MESARAIAPDTFILPSFYPIPGYGLLPTNAYMLKSAQPVLVDTGMHYETDDFVRTLEGVIDPEDIRWLYLTHPDQDHVGSLMRLMRRLPDLKLVTNFLGFGILTTFTDLTPDRLYLLNPGEKLDVGDRELVALRPPTFDNPATMSLFDPKTHVLFSSDSFGALLDGPAMDANDVAADALQAGQVLWATVDAPWLHKVDQAKFAAELDAVRRLEPEVVASSHLPPAHRMVDVMLGSLATVPDSRPFVGPNQAALQQMLAQLTQQAPAN